jgi:2,4-dienoyl-CoA reductase-like NADH-dependent reductase (Old Yellow Enzyme family)
VLRAHCDAVGRDPDQIEVTAMFRNLPDSPSRDDVLRCAEEYAKVGVSTLVVGATGPDPGGWLESTMGPAIDGLAEIPSIRP